MLDAAVDVTNDEVLIGTRGVERQRHDRFAPQEQTARTVDVTHFPAAIPDGDTLAGADGRESDHDPSPCRARSVARTSIRTRPSMFFPLPVEPQPQ